MKRAAVFAFYDAEGIVDDYVPVLLNGVKPYVEKLVCVVNGELQPEGEKTLRNFCDDVWFRENKGYDVTAYKEGISFLKNSEEIWDEVIFFNATVYGPIGSFEEVFKRMSEKSVDFWGMSRHKLTLSNYIEGSGMDYIPEHIQSYFFGVRKSLFYSDDFQQYWDKLGEINTYFDAVTKHEIVFTNFFSDKGYTWCTFIEPDLDEDYYQYLLMSKPVELIAKEDVPVIKRKVFLHTVPDQPLVPIMGEANKLFKYIRYNTDYDFQLIVNDILRKECIQDYEDALFSTFYCEKEKSAQKEKTGTVSAYLIINSSRFVKHYLKAYVDKASKIVFVCIDEDVKKEVANALPTLFKGDLLIGRSLEDIADYIESDENDYIFFSSNCFIPDATTKRTSDEYTFGMEELYKSTVLFSDFDKLIDILSNDLYVKVLIPVASQYNATLSRNGSREATKKLGIDVSANRSASMTFFAKKDSICNVLKKYTKVLAGSTQQYDMAFAAYCAKENRGLVGYVTSAEVEKSFSQMLLPSFRENRNNKNLAIHYDNARAFMYNFLTEKSFKERLWFLLLTISPRRRRQLFEAQKEKLLNMADWPQNDVYL